MPNEGEKLEICITDLSPNALGEILRGQLFDEGKDGVGCYSTFDLMPDWTSLSRDEAVELLRMAYGEIGTDYQWEPSDWDYRLDDWRRDAVAYRKYFANNLTVRAVWHWDGDGTLAFHLGNRMIVNTDCKKDYDWEEVPL